MLQRIAYLEVYEVISKPSPQLQFTALLHIETYFRLSSLNEYSQEIPFDSHDLQQGRWPPHYITFPLAQYGICLVNFLTLIFFSLQALQAVDSLDFLDELSLLRPSATSTPEGLTDTLSESTSAVVGSSLPGSMAKL